MIELIKKDNNFIIIYTTLNNFNQLVYFSYNTPIFYRFLLDDTKSDLLYKIDLSVNNTTKYSTTTTKQKNKFIFEQKNGVLQLEEGLFSYLLNLKFNNDQKNLELFSELCSQKDKLLIKERVEKMIILKELGQDLQQLFKDFFFSEEF